jgi:hypothetical protein
MMTQQNTHEILAREEKITLGSERSFAIVISVALALISSINWWYGGTVWRWLGAIAVIFIVLGFLYPAALKPLNWLWFKFGLLLHAIVNPIIMGLLFYVTVLPTGLVMRAMGKDLLRLKPDPDSDSYWIARKPPGPAPETMKDQF